MNNKQQQKDKTMPEEITFNKDEQVFLLKALSQLDGVLFTLKDVPDAAFCVLEEVSEMVTNKVLGKGKQ